MDHSLLPRFKYNPNVYESGYVIFDEVICDCCGRKVQAYINSIFSEKAVENVCMECVDSGEAARKFNATFIADADEVDNAEAVEELFHRTPGYLSWQGEQWASCCNDYCEYIGTVGIKELEELGIDSDFFDENGSYDGWSGVRDLLFKDGDICGYLFRCLHCGKYYLRIDAN